MGQCRRFETRSSHLAGFEELRICAPVVCCTSLAIENLRLALRAQLLLVLTQASQHRCALRQILAQLVGITHACFGKRQIRVDVGCTRTNSRQALVVEHNTLDRMGTSRFKSDLNYFVFLQPHSQAELLVGHVCTSKAALCLNRKVLVGLYMCHSVVNAPSPTARRCFLVWQEGGEACLRGRCGTCRAPSCRHRWCGCHHTSACPLQQAAG